MKIFLLQADSEYYQTLFPKNEDDFDLIKKFNGVRFGDNWTPIAVEILIEDYDEEILPAGDFSCLTTDAIPIFNKKAVTALHDLLQANGELLPLSFEAGEYYAYNTTTFVDALDLAHCDAVYFPAGRLMDVRKYAFFS